MERLFQLVERYCFQGHTHVPGVFTEGFQFYAPEEIDNEYTLGEGKLMINVGSVGQPRDGDNRACYVILDDGRPDDEWVEAAMRRIRPPAVRSASPIAGCPTTSRPRSRRSTPSPSWNRSWATGSARVVETRKATRLDPQRRRPAPPPLFPSVLCFATTPGSSATMSNEKRLFLFLLLTSARSWESST